MSPITRVFARLGKRLLKHRHILRDGVALHRFANPVVIDAEVAGQREERIEVVNVAPLAEIGMGIVVSVSRLGFSIKLL